MNIIRAGSALLLGEPPLYKPHPNQPFIRHDSAVHYSSARWLAVAGLLMAMRVGNCHLKEDMSRELLARVRAGLLESPFTVNALREQCRKLF